MRLSSWHYKVIGQEIWQKYPARATGILLPYIKNQPRETNLSKLTGYFDSFCDINNLNKEEYYGPIYKTKKVDMLRIFIASMIHLYYPEIYFQPIEELNLKKKGFVTALAESMGKPVSNVSNMIRDAIVWENRYDDFKEKVEFIVDQLKNAA